MASGNQCFCGVDGFATCLKCGQRRCATHYLLDVYPYGTAVGTFWAATTPRGTVQLPFLRGDDVAAKAYAAEDAACTKCREAAADNASAKRASEVATDVRSYLKAPSSSALVQLADASRYLTADDLHKILAATWPFLAPGHECITVRVDAERCGLGKRRTRATATVTARKPAVLIQADDSFALLEGGRLLGVSRLPIGATTDGSSVHMCIVSKRAVPHAVCYRAYTDGEGNLSGPSVSLSSGFAVLREPAAPRVDLLLRQRLPWHGQKPAQGDHDPFWTT
jgi:hypothetical protein